MPNIKRISTNDLFFCIMLLLCPKAGLANDNLARLMETRNCSFCDFREIQIRSSINDLTDQPTVVDLTETYLVHADFSRADLTKVIFAKSYLNGARFVGANLSGADFRGSELELADFSGADLTNAIFFEAYLLHARLSGKQLMTVKLCQTTLPNGIISHRDCN